MEYRVQVLDPEDRQQVARCFRVFAVLRQHLDEKAFAEQVRIQAREAYEIAYIEDVEVRAAAGYRVAHFLAWGKILYVDDLITDPEHKNKGLGGALMDWLIAEAKRQGCEEVHLDTGFQRHDAHRLYLNKGLALSCHHLSMRIKA